LNAIVLVTNSLFKIPLNVVLYGLSKYSFFHDVIIFYDEYFTELEHYKQIYSNLKINLKQINTKNYNNLRWTIHNRDWTINPFYRYEIFNLSEYSKILYLDLDILILSELNSVFEYEGNFCAVELAKVTNLTYVPYGQRGFNAGVMLIGKKYLNDCTKEALIQLSQNGVQNGNQKPLNFYFANKVSFLDYKYNLTTDLLTPERIDEAKIVHFIGQQKPWENKGIYSFCDYVRKISGDHLLIKVYNMFQKESKEALQRLKI